MNLMCNECRMTPCHPRCPNHKPYDYQYTCSICGEGIFVGEEYLENNDGEYRHCDCFYGTKDLLQWLGYEIKTMEDFNEDY